MTAHSFAEIYVTEDGKFVAVSMLPNNSATESSSDVVQVNSQTSWSTTNLKVHDLMSKNTVVSSTLCSSHRKSTKVKKETGFRTLRSKLSHSTKTVVSSSFTRMNQKQVQAKCRFFVLYGRVDIGAGVFEGG